VVAGAALVVGAAATASGPVLGAALAEGKLAAVLVDGLRSKYRGTAINIAAHTSATIT
jgi:hypothetical protein